MIWWASGVPPHAQKVLPCFFRWRCSRSGSMSPPTRRSLKILSFGRGSVFGVGGSHNLWSSKNWSSSACFVQLSSRAVLIFIFIPTCAPSKSCRLSRASCLHTLRRHRSRRSCCQRVLNVRWFRQLATQGSKTSSCKSCLALVSGPS